MMSHTNATSTDPRTSELLHEPWLQAALTAGLSLIPARTYPRWLRRGMIWAPTVIGVAGSAYLAANPEAHRKFLEYVPESERRVDAEQQLSSVNPVAVTAVGGAVGAAFTAVLAVSFWADEKIEQGLRRAKVPFPRVAMGFAAGAASWVLTKKDNELEQAKSKS